MTTTLKSAMKDSLKRSLKVMGLVSLDALTRDEREEVVVVCYENCREQGFSLKVKGLNETDLQISWAECRGSDQMVVYVGTSKDFREFPYGNIPNETVYRESANYFSTEKQAAAFIQKLVVKACKTARAEMTKALAKKDE